MEIIRKLIRTEEDINEMISETGPSPIISFDTENNGLNPLFAIPAGFSVAIKTELGFKGWYVPIRHYDKQTDWSKYFKDVISNKKIVVMHNSPYDASIVKCQYPGDAFEELEKLTWFDTMIAQHLLDENNPKGLKILSERYFGYKQATFAETVENNDPTSISSEMIADYAIDDAIFTLRLFYEQKEKLKEEALAELMMDIEMPFQKVLTHMKCNGITFDSDLCIETEKRLQENRLLIIQKIIDVTPQISYINNLMGGRTLTTNLDSSKDLADLLYNKLKLPIIRETDSGASSVDAPTLELMKENGEWLHPIIPLLLEYKEGEKLLSAYTHSLNEKVINGKIYPDFLDHGTTTGRLSSRNPNFQQLPKNDTYKIRCFFKASEGYKMMVSDFSQEELRVAGVVAGSAKFKKAFEEGQDLHLKVANGVWNLGIPEDALRESHPEYSSYKDKFKKYRHKAKFINFGTIYGIGPDGLAALADCSKEEAQQMLTGYFETFPEMKRAIEVCKQEIKLKGNTRNLFGRKRRFEKVQGKYYANSVFRQGFNFKIQGSCADILRIVMNKVYQYVKLNPEVKILGTVHDEVMYEIKDNENFNKHVEEINNIMQNSVKLLIPLTTDYDIGNNYGEAK